MVWGSGKQLQSGRYIIEKQLNPNPDDELYCRFEEYVRWRVKGSWIGRHSSTVRGHFPCPWEFDSGTVVKFEVLSLLYRVEECGL